MHLLGIDIGGTKTALCIGTDQGRILAGRRIPTDPHRPDHTLARALETVRELLGECALDIGEIDAIGISSPGPMCSRRRMILETPNLPGWSGIRLGDYFERAFDRPTYMHNDANGAGLAEHLFGACKGMDLVYLTMSTGIGAGIITSGTLLSGVCDLGGEVGHMTLDVNGPLCGCGKTGCWEAYCGGRRFAERFRQDLAETGGHSAALGLANGDPGRITMKEICEAVRRGDPFALAHWDLFIEKMAHGIGLLLQALNPQAIILGTLAIHHGDLFLPQVRARLPRYAWQGAIDACRIESTVLKQIGELGALAIALDGAIQLKKESRHA